jgi:hypothetical protein
MNSLLLALGVVMLTIGGSGVAIRTVAKQPELIKNPDRPHIGGSTEAKRYTFIWPKADLVEPSLTVA